MAIHIGKLINEKLIEKNETPSWLAQQMGRSIKEVQRILSKPSINTGDLDIISEILNVNFFMYYQAEVEEYLSKA
ncbi:MAG: XRE family transcriptional regulator [Bacteroidales bacterium]|jgi:plasmid maintenance system antidote protein VapI|nr:XRE family transcriptional regulator [Bacteroidales bacterium]